MFTVTVVDETTAGARGEAWHLEIFEETCTLRELIRRRVDPEKRVASALELTMDTQVTFLRLVPLVGG